MFKAPSPRRGQGVGWSTGLVLLVLLAFLSCAVGSRTIPLADTWQAFTAYDADRDTDLLVILLRVPRTLLAVAVGAALGLAGTLMQALTRNPLAEPGLLGVNAGAAAAVAVGLVLFGASTAAGQMWWGFAGAAGASLLVYLLGRAHDGGNNPTRLVLAGAGLSVMLLAFTSIVLLTAESQVQSQYRVWATGSLQARGYDVLPWVAGVCLVAAAISVPLARSLDSLALGHDLGVALGVRIRTTWITGTLAILLLAGAATAAAGPIAFLGLAAPHVGRLFVGPGHRRLMPFSMLVGALALLAADILGRVVTAPAEIGAGVMTALVGAPFFIALARRRKMVHL